MKAFIFVLFAAILISCEKDIATEPDRYGCPFYSERDTCTFKTGRYSGTSRLIIPGRVDIVNAAYFELFQYENMYVIRWWTAPDTIALSLISDTLRYSMCYDRVNLSCGYQRSIYDYVVRSWRLNDSLFTEAIVRYRWYHENELITDLPGTFTACYRYVDSKTPNKNSFNP